MTSYTLKRDAEVHEMKDAWFTPEAKIVVKRFKADCDAQAEALVRREYPEGVWICRADAKWWHKA